MKPSELRVHVTATFLSFGELQRALLADKPTAWFPDDLGQAIAAVQEAYMQIKWRDDETK